MQRGRRAASSRFVVVAAPACPASRSTAVRLGITVSRKVGNAVVRSRMKRLIREWFRRHRKELDGPADLVVIARRPAVSLGWGEIDGELTRLTRRALQRLPS